MQLDSAGRGERSQEELKHTDERANERARACTHVADLLLQLLYACVQPVLTGISPIYIHVWSISCSTNRLRSAAHMALPERRRETEGG